MAGLVLLLSMAASIQPLLDVGSLGAWVLVTAVQLGHCLSLVWRRTNVVRMALVIALVSAVQLATIPTPLVSDIAVLIGLYSAARWSRSVVVRYAVLAGGLVAAVGAAFRWPVITTATGVAVYFAFLAGLGFLAWLIGDLTGRRARYLAGIEAQNLALLREREQAIALAKAEERNDIARELHDVLAHSLAVIAVQAEGAAYATSNEQKRRWESIAATLDTIAHTARESLAETRRVVSHLRSTAPPVTDASPALPNTDPGLEPPTPDLTDVARLCSRVTESGRRVDLRMDGEVAVIPAEVSRAAYRILQDSLTNALKYGRQNDPINVEVEHRTETLHLVVTNTVYPSRSTRPHDKPGYGVVGMLERARSVGGHLTAAADHRGRFVVEAHLPGGGAS